MVRTAIAAFSCLLMIACASPQQNGVSVEVSEPVRELANYENWTSKSYPKLIDGGASYQVKIQEISKPISFRLFVGISLADSEINATLTTCGKALETGVEKVFDVRGLRAPFEDVAREQLERSRASAVDHGPMVLSILWRIADIPEQLEAKAKTKYCLVRSNADIGEKYFEGDDLDTAFVSPFNFLPPDLNPSLFKSEKIYLVAPEDLRQAIEMELEGILDRTIPTLIHQIDDVDCLFYERSKFAPHKDKCKSLISSQQSSAP